MINPQLTESGVGLTCEPTFSRGPEYSSRFKSPSLLPGESTVSASSQATGCPEQVCELAACVARYPF